MIQRLQVTEPQSAPPDPYVRPNAPQAELWLPLDHRDQPLVVTKPPLRRVRFQVVLALFAFTCGSLLIILNSPFRNEFLAPGPLTQQHAQLLAANGGDRCAACHSAGAGSFTQWLTDMLTGGQTFPTEQVTLCLNCHQTQIEQTLAKLPHTVPTEKLAALTERQQSRSPQTVHWLAQGKNPAELACATCHREHHGTHFNLAAMSDSQCQTCHVQAFRSFETNHPPFDWSKAARPRTISFDHQSHASRHFAQKGQAFSCQQCHQPDGQQNVMLTASFAQACADCHRDSMEGQLQTGLPWLALPSLDQAAFRAAGIEIGVWPSALSQSFDGQLTPYMLRLLQTDPAAAAALSKLGNQFRFEDLEDADADTLQHAASVVAAVKRLFWDLANRGPSAVRERLGAGAAGTQFLHDEQQLLPFMNELLFRDAVVRWFPGLIQEMQEVGRPTPQTLGWLPSDHTALARWSPRVDEILVPNPLADKMSGLRPVESNVGPDQPQTPARPQSSASLSVPLQSEAEQGTWKNELRSAENKQQQGSVIPDDSNGQSNPAVTTPPGLAEHQHLLIDNPIQRLFGSTDGVTAAVQPGNRQAIEDSVGNLDSQRSKSDASPNSQNANHSDIEPATESFSIAQLDWGALNTSSPRDRTGWYRDDQTFQIKYYPLGHADPFLTAWTSLAHWESTSQPTVGSSSTHPLDALKAPEYSGQCQLCHRPQVVFLAPGNQISGLAIKSTAYRKNDSGSDKSAANLQGIDPSLTNTRAAGAELTSSPDGATRATTAGFSANVSTPEIERLAELWKSNLRSPDKKEFTKFNHAPHLLLQDCQSCHQLPNASKTSEESIHNSAWLSDFRPIEQFQCATCHRENQSPNQCTTCHYYHVDSNRRPSLFSEPSSTANR